MGLEVQLQQPITEAAQVLGGDPVLKPGQSRLGGQVAVTLRGLAGHDLESRVLGQGSGIIVVFVPLGNGEQALPYQSQKIMFNLVTIPRIMEAAGGVFSDSVALIQLPEQQAAGIGGDPAPGKIGHDFLGEKAFKDELLMADCFHRVSLLRSCLFSDNSILADTLCIFKHFSVNNSG